MYTAENVLNRDFTEDHPNEKWVTDVSEFKYYTGIEVHTVYLSAILDLYDRRIVAYQIGDHNNNPLVMNTFGAAVAAESNASPLFHSDRGFQYTSRAFHQRLVNHHMVQSMSRVGHCIDNGPMEGFWGILKREMYYGKRFTERATLVKTIEGYITYYNTKRIERRLKLMMPIEYHEHFRLAA
jgi:putative transposase